jgi:hypothetical protein
MKTNIDTKKLVREYQEADALLTSRIQDKRYGFDNFDKLYQTYIDPTKWPYSVKLATPRGFTSIFNKTTRIVGGKFTGRVEPIEQADESGAKIASEHFRYSVERFNQYSDTPIEVKVAICDTNTRLYGAGFLRTYWRVDYKYVTEKGEKVKKIKYNNWWVEVLNNRDLLTQPGVESDPEYYIHRRYLTLEDIETHQEDGADYNKKSLDELREAKTGSGKDANYTPIVKLIKGQDYTDTRFEVCTTYYKDQFITWCPKIGTKGKMKALVLRVIDNPYRHQTIPIVPLVYIPSQEDIYGMSELQPVSALLKILSALQSQFIELVNKNLYPPTLVQATETRMDTFKYRPKAFWLVNNPAAVTVLDTKASQSLAEFSQVYQMVVTEFLEAMGETGTGVSSVDIMGGDKTATEVNDRAYLRGSRDNFNKMLLQSSLKKLMYQLFEMLRDPKFTDKNTVIRVVGKEALEYFDKQGYSSWNITDEGYQVVMDAANNLSENEEFANTAKEQGESLYDIAYKLLASNGALDSFAEPLSPVTTAEGMIEKLKYDEDRNTGYLTIDPETDYLGEFNFLPDVEALTMPNPERDYQSRAMWYKQASEAEQTGALSRDGVRLKHKDILSKMAELIRIKDADQYFEKMEEVPYDANQAGAGNQAVGPGGQGVPPGQPIPGAPGALEPAVGAGVPQASGGAVAGPVPLR